MNKKRIIITLSIILCVLIVFSFFSTSTKMIKGKTINVLVKETDLEFDLENDAILRNLPTLLSQEKNTIPKGTHVKVLQELNKWVEITDGNKTGWVVKQKVVTIDSQDVPTPPVDEPVEPAKPLNNQTNTVVSNKVENKPIANTSNTSGPTNTISNVGKTGVVNVDTAKVRETPDGETIGLVDLNDKVEILSEEGDWYKANIDEYKNCYIAKRLVTIK